MITQLECYFGKSVSNTDSPELNQGSSANLEKKIDEERLQARADLLILLAGSVFLFFLYFALNYFFCG